MRQQRRLRNLRRRVSTWALPPLIWIVGHTPTWLLRPCFRGIARIAARTRIGHTARAQLGQMLGDRYTAEQRAELAANLCRNLADAFVDVAAVLYRDFDDVDARVDDSEARRIFEVHADVIGRGFVGVTGHVGNWELLPRFGLRSSPCPVQGIVAKRLPNPWLNRIVEDVRNRTIGCPTIYRDAPPSVLLRVLRGGGVVGILPDQDVPALPGVFVEFFGRPAYPPVGPARIAIAANRPIVPLFLVHAGGGQYRVVAREPIVPDPGNPRGEEILRLTQAYTTVIEEVIRDHPDQWPWFHARWETTPEKLELRGRERVAL